ncbi:B2 protein [Nymphaea colorata]|nr:B2 protein [Nymphaea colorata]
MDSQQSFWQFSDKLRLDLPGNSAGGPDDFLNNRWAFNSSSHINSFSNLSIGDSIWSRSDDRVNGNWLNDRVNENWTNDRVNEKRMNDRVNEKRTNEKMESWRNPDGKGKAKQKGNSEMNAFNDGWKFGGSKAAMGKSSVNGRVAENPKVNKYNHNGSSGKPNNNSNNNGVGAKHGKGNNGGNATAVDKRFKTLPPSESLPRGEQLGGYIFVCNNDTMEDDLRRQLFGLPQRYRDSVRAITPGLPLFLYNYSTHQLHGIFEAASFGGTNIDPMAWEDKKCPGESRFPAQVKVVTRKVCPPLEEDSFRPVLHHYDGPKFRLQLSIPEALALLDIFEEKSNA